MDFMFVFVFRVRFVLCCFDLYCCVGFASSYFALFAMVCFRCLHVLFVRSLVRPFVRPSVRWFVLFGLFICLFVCVLVC